MKSPQPFQYQGIKRFLAPLILRYLPEKMARLVEPFAGSALLATVVFFAAGMDCCNPLFT